MEREDNTFAHGVADAVGTAGAPRPANLDRRAGLRLRAGLSGNARTGRRESGNTLTDRRGRVDGFFVEMTLNQSVALAFLLLFAHLAGASVSLGVHLNICWAVLVL